MKKDNLIEVEGISKKYRINNISSYSLLREEVVNYLNPFKKRKEEDLEYVWALKNVSFEIKKGEAVGLIGLNGAGKSTVLKLLSRITYPTEGEIRMRGRVSSLLETGTGFHPELTGKENIFLNGTVLGMRKWEIQKQFENIIRFAGVERFLDTPIKHYSSGMYTRLAFSVAAHLNQDIIIIDEVLSVGDLSFQSKALDKISQMEKDGKTVIFVSHNMSAISRVCNKVIWLDHGKLIEIGDANSVIKKYTSNMGKINQTKNKLKDSKNYNLKIGLDKFRFDEIEIKPRNAKRKEIYFKEPFKIIIKCNAREGLENFSVGLSINSLTGGSIFNTYSLDSGLKKIYKKGDIKFQVEIDPNVLLPGSYLIDLFAFGSGISEIISESLQFQVLDISDHVEERLGESGLISYPANWTQD